MKPLRRQSGSASSSGSPGRSPAADGGDHIDSRVLGERRRKTGSLPVDVHVDVVTERRACLAEAVADARPLLVESSDRRLHRGGVDIEPAWKVVEERRQRRGQMDIGHG